MEPEHEQITLQAFLAKDGSKHAWAAGLTRGDGKAVQQMVVAEILLN